MRPLAERLWEKVDRSGEGCWPYTGHLGAKGYGQMRTGGRDAPRLGVHVIAYMLEVGPVPEGWHVDHVRARGCVLRSCCRPDHLEAVPPAENGRRSDSPSALNARKEVCKHGHDLTDPANVYEWKGHRLCQPCRREAHKRWLAKQE